jgi:hypothetical protein
MARAVLVGRCGQAARSTGVAGAHLHPAPVEPTMNAPHTLPARLAARTLGRTVCPRCAAANPVTSPPRGARAAWYATWASLALLLFGAVLTGLLVVVFGPLLAILGAPVLAYVGTLCDALPTCTRCGSYLSHGDTGS